MSGGVGGYGGYDYAGTPAADYCYSPGGYDAGGFEAAPDYGGEFAGHVVVGGGHNQDNGGHAAIDFGHHYHDAVGQHVVVGGGHNQHVYAAGSDVPSDAVGFWDGVSSIGSAVGDAYSYWFTPTQIDEDAPSGEFSRLLDPKVGNDVDQYLALAERAQFGGKIQINYNMQKDPYAIDIPFRGIRGDIESRAWEDRYLESVANTDTGHMTDALKDLALTVLSVLAGDYPGAGQHAIEAGGHVILDVKQGMTNFINTHHEACKEEIAAHREMLENQARQVQADRLPDWYGVPDRDK